MDTKRMGISFNDCRFMGRVINNPEYQGEWARFQLMTIVPEKVGNDWVEQECVVPVMTNNPRTIQTIQNYVQAERQLYVTGYLKSWVNQQGVMESAIVINTIKLGSKTIYKPQEGGGQQMGGGQQQMGGGQPNQQMGGQQMGGQQMGGQGGMNPF